MEENRSDALILGCAITGGLLIALLVVTLVVGAVLLSFGLTAHVEPPAVISAAPAIPPVLAHDAAPDGSAYQWEVFSSGFDNPVFITHAGDGSGRLFGVEQYGLIWIIEPDGTQRDEPFLDISTLISADVQRGTYTERGLLSIAFDPEYRTNRTFYVSYTDMRGDSRIARYRTSATNPNRADPNSGEIILELVQPAYDHNGGQIAFGPDGYLYAGFGDGGSIGDQSGNGQSGQTWLGKLLRLDVRGQATYAVPPDNPFVDQPDFLPEIWAYGLRNPWRFSFDRATDDLYIGEVGQWMVEEINFQPAGSPGGENYGWSVYEGLLLHAGEAPNGFTMTEPVATYSHSEGCSVTGGYVYRGSALPELNGYYFYGDYCNGFVWTLWRDAAGNWQHALFQETERQISSFGEDEAGELYLVDYKGDILRLTGVP
ncbi:PQQ-dependent sugar dehydrogenase [Anaerolineae bacterium CFX9]|nr:PQQ-dependent sugar dehydrogenase [Anaerolineae bacterium CFX9]